MFLTKVPTHIHQLHPHLAAICASKMHKIHFLLEPFCCLSASSEAYRNCLSQRYFTSKGRGIGYSFQLAITAPLYSITGYCIATAQSWRGWAKREICTSSWRQLWTNRFFLNFQPISFVLFHWFCSMDSMMAYLPGVEVNHDHEGGSSRMRLSHCTSGQLTPTMVSNVDHLNAQFLLVGDCVRAIP